MNPHNPIDSVSAQVSLPQKQLLSYPPVSHHPSDVDQAHSAFYSRLSGSTLCKLETETAFKRNLLRTVCVSPVLLSVIRTRVRLRQVLS